MNFLTSSLTERVKNYAINNWRCYSFKQEWLSIILLVLTVKIATSAVSVFSGYYYLVDVYRGLFGSETLQKTFAVISLTLIELLNALFLAKAFKFILRLNNLKWIFPLLLSAGLFVISFVTSTNGIALYTSNKVDISATINDKYATKITAINAETSANVDLIKERITNIKENPTDWKNGQRCILSATQLKEISDCYDKIAAYQNYKELKIKELTQEKNAELSENQAVTTNTAERYYMYVSVIMCIQIVSSFLLWFFWCKISAEDDTENEQKETITNSLENVLKSVDTCINSRINSRIGVLNTIYSGIAAQTPVKQPETPETAPETATTPCLKIVGFGRNTATPKTPENEPQKATDTANVLQQHGNPENAPENVKKCLFCGDLLTPSKIIRGAKYCCDSCRIKAYNQNHPERKPLKIPPEKLC